MNRADRAEEPAPRDEPAYWAAILLQHALCAPAWLVRSSEPDPAEYVDTFAWSPRDRDTPGWRAPLTALTMAIVRVRPDRGAQGPAEASIVLNIPTADDLRTADSAARFGDVTTFPANLVLEGLDVAAAFRGRLHAVRSVIDEVDRQLDEVPAAGARYRRLRDADTATGPILRALPEPPVSFEFQHKQMPHERARNAASRGGCAKEPAPVIDLSVTMNSRVPEMTAHWTIDRNVLSERDIGALRSAWRLALSRIVFESSSTHEPAIGG
ncbi:hypothetical protein [Nocardia sp. CY41]|uniref:hypothetical protein n=1 Tax=Nocardia sp. CY41 TaxID=2608686 RepID=UPI00135B28BE|nr:hypothetical protein [Nocardia sp. CY41]